MANYKIKNVGANKCLNIYGDNVTYLTNNQNVTLWEDSGTNEQRWSISSLGSAVFVRPVINTTFGLNVYRSGSPWNCDVYPVSGNETDAQITFIASGGYYKIKLTNYNQYLTVGASGNGTNVYWAAASSSSYQLWNCISTDGYGQPVSSYSELYGLSDIDLIARCIYSEARGEIDTGKRGVACVIRNRKNRNTTEFGGGTYSGVVLKAGQFSGMTTSAALAPDTSSSAWTTCVSIAQSIANISNPIGTCLWFYASWLYNQNVTTSGSTEYINLGGGSRAVIEKYIIGNHTFFKVSGY